MTEPLSTPPPVFIAPVPRDPAVQTALDDNHLRLLEIGFYISGVMTIFRLIWLLFVAAFFAVIGVTAAMAAANHPSMSANGPPPEIFFVMFGVFFVIMILLTIVFIGLEFYAGICLKNRKHLLLVQVVAALYCLSIPWGTALGICTFMVLNRPSVQARFS